MEEHYPEILRRFMGEERDGSFEYYDKTTKDAAEYRWSKPEHKCCG
jgi:hypothetical protein